MHGRDVAVRVVGLGVLVSWGLFIFLKVCKLYCRKRRQGGRAGCKSKLGIFYIFLFIFFF